MNAISIIEKVTGKKVISQQSKIKEWSDWYAGNVKSFHNYTIKNGKKSIKMRMLTLGMPKKICEDWANLLLNEKTDIVLANEAERKSFYKILSDNKFWKKGNKAIEKTFALSMGAFLESVEDLIVDENGSIVERSGRVRIQFINATNIYPLTLDGDTIKECAFVSGDNDKSVISIHQINKQTGNYEITNIYATGKPQSLVYNDDSVEIFDTGSGTPWFQIITPNIVNNIDVNSPLGISVFANAIDNCKLVDKIFDSIYNEFNLGRKRIYLSTRALTLDPVTGEYNEVFDTNDVAFYLLPESDDGKPLIKEDNGELRVDAHDQGIQRALNLLSSKVGFGSNHYKFEAGGVATATQVISENSELFRSLKKHEIILEEALIDLTKAIIYISNNFTNVSFTENQDITIKFDDSIIEDKESEKASDRLDVNLGVMTKAEYRAKWYGEDDATAKAKVEEAKAEQPQIVDYFSE